jgi:hypothetical protein
MRRFEYKMAPLPGSHPDVRKRRRSPADYAAAVLEAVVNEHAADGWEFDGTETVTSVARKSMLSAKAAVTHTILVFRRPVDPAPQASFADLSDGPTFEPDAKLSTPITLDDEPDAGLRRGD